MESYEGDDGGGAQGGSRGAGVGLQPKRDPRGEDQQVRGNEEVQHVETDVSVEAELDDELAEGTDRG